MIGALRPVAGEGVELRPGVGLDFFGRHGDQHDAFGTEIAAVLADGCGGLPLAIDELELSGFISLRRRGLDIRDAADLLDEVRDRRGQESPTRP